MKNLTPSIKDLLPPHGYFGARGWEIRFPGGKAGQSYATSYQGSDRADCRKAHSDARLFIKGCRKFYKYFFKPSLFNVLAVSFTGKPTRTAENFRKLIRTDDMISIANGCHYYVTDYVDGTCVLTIKD
jgi:hypothetical protein